MVGSEGNKVGVPEVKTLPDLTPGVKYPTFIIVNPGVKTDQVQKNKPPTQSELRNLRMSFYSKLKTS